MLVWTIRPHARVKLSQIKCHVYIHVNSNNPRLMIRLNCHTFTYLKIKLIFLSFRNKILTVYNFMDQISHWKKNSFHLTSLWAWPSFFLFLFLLPPQFHKSYKIKRSHHFWFGSFFAATIDYVFARCEDGRLNNRTDG